ncbi:hypothetical protein Tco_0316816 [Tanacetum coccineum]
MGGISLSWVNRSIVLGHKNLQSGIEGRRAKVDVNRKLPHQTTVKGVEVFLGHDRMQAKGLMRGSFCSKNLIVVIVTKKGAENLATDHLSRLENPHQDKLENKEITETFPLETLGGSLVLIVPSGLRFRKTIMRGISCHSSSLHRVSPTDKWAVEVSNRGLKEFLKGQWAKIVPLGSGLWMTLSGPSVYSNTNYYIGCTPYSLYMDKRIVSAD